MPIRMCVLGDGTGLLCGSSMGFCRQLVIGVVCVDLVAPACSASAADASKDLATSPGWAPRVCVNLPAVPWITCVVCECFQRVIGAMLGWPCAMALHMRKCSSCPKTVLSVHLDNGNGFGE